jgi:hypothetical protein
MSGASPTDPGVPKLTCEGSERQRPTASARRDRKSGREGPAAASTPQPSGSAASPGAPARPEAARQAAAPPPEEEARKVICAEPY